VKGGGREWWRWKRVVEGEKERKKTVEGRKRGGKVRRRKRHSNIAPSNFFHFFFQFLSLSRSNFLCAPSKKPTREAST